VKWILVYVITTLHLQGGIKAVSVTTHDFESREACERVAQQIKLEMAEVMHRVDAKHSCTKK
jgi:hypothetical protein